jgi:hypothetical protein
MAAAEQARERPEKVPPGWKTAPQIASELGRSLSAATKLVRGLVASGAAECRKFRVVAGLRVYPTPHYRLKKGS